MQHISYKDDEIADNDVDYFLIQMNSNLNASTLNNAREITIRIDGELVLEGNRTNSTINFPFYCFNDENVSSIDNLNFNELKKCQDLTTKNTYKYMVVFLNQINALHIVGGIKNKSPQQWNKQKPEISFELTNQTYNMSKHYGTMLKIFHTQYKPEIKTTTE